MAGEISAEVFYDGWQHNAKTNKGKDPGPPKPIVPYQDRLGEDKGKELVTWRNEEGTECKGTTALHKQQIAASLRETSRDPKAKVTGEDKELQRREKSALNQNKMALDFGDDNEASSRKATSARRGSAEITKVRKDHFVKTGKAKERQESPTKATEPPAPRAKNQKRQHSKLEPVSGQKPGSQERGPKPKSRFECFRLQPGKPNQ